MANRKIVIDGVEYTAEPEKKRRGLKEFSKKVVAGMILLWFLGAFFAAAVILKHGYGMEALLNYIGMPMGAGVVGYLLKSAFENREKIKTGASQEGEDHP